MAISVRHFYDEHPINEVEILEKIAAEGIARDAIKAEDLSRYDQDHYGGTAATDALADSLGIKAGMSVLDLCSGMGGTSRYLAYRYGVEVLGIDLTPSRVEGAQRLTELVGLSKKVHYRVGDASNLDLASETFDRIVSQESFLHTTGKASLFDGCHRVLKAGGGLGFTDVITAESLSSSARQRFGEQLAASGLISAEAYASLMTSAGFTHVQMTDLSAAWRVILHDRLAMYRSLEAETVKRFGRDRFDTYIDTYEFFIAQIDAGAVGGARLVGWKL